jgi:DNA polymerase III epsilon subunit-like protein
MTLLFVDTETSGLFKKNLPLDSDQQPWVVSLAADLCDDVGRQIASINTGIRANGRKITEDARAVHGVSSATAGRTGVSELAALGVLCGRESFASQARYVIGHGVSFDRDVITSVLARNGRDATTWVRPGLQFVDTMLASTPFCKLPSGHEAGGYKWPSLDEACELLLNEPPRTGPHNAWDDVQRAKLLFFWLRSHGALEIGEAA